MVTAKPLRKGLALLDLPTEVLSMICSHATSETYTLGLTCRQLRATSEPILYRKIVLIIPRENNVRYFESLISTLTARPDLRPHVVELALHIYVPDFNRKVTLLALLPNLRDLVLDLPIHNLDINPLTKLKTLSLDCSNAYTYDLTQDDVEWNVLSLRGFIVKHICMPSLRTLELQYPNVFLSELGDAFKRQADSQSQSSQNNQSALIQRGSGSSPVTTLRLLDCRPGTFTKLPDMLQLIKRLECFTFLFSYGFDLSYIPPTPSPSNLASALAPHAGTIVELTIAGDDGATFNMESPQSGFGTLSHYRCLKRLAIPEKFLTQASKGMELDLILLPAQLEDVQLQYQISSAEEDPDVFRHLQHGKMRQLASAKLASFPDLKRVIWWYHQALSWTPGGKYINYGDADELEKMVGIFKDVGVEFKWLSAPLYDHTPFGGQVDNGKGYWG